jgi:hypothetical protein
VPPRIEWHGPDREEGQDGDSDGAQPRRVPALSQPAAIRQFFLVHFDP